MRDSDLVHFFKDWAKMKIPSEICPPLLTYCKDNFFVHFVKMGKSWKYLLRFCHLLLQNEKDLRMFYDILFHQKKIHCIKEFLIVSTKITLNRFSKYSIEYWKQAPCLKINYCIQKMGGLGLNRNPWQLKNQNPGGATLELPDKGHCQSSPFCSFSG